MDAALSWLEALPLANWIRTAVWPFPVVNTLHVIGISLLFGGVAVLDLRLLGVGAHSMPVSPLARLTLPLALTGLAIALVTGFLMFAASPQEYWANAYLHWKLGLIAAAGANALLLHVTIWRDRDRWGEHTPACARAAGFASLGLWAGVITCGRLMAYL